LCIPSLVIIHHLHGLFDVSGMYQSEVTAQVSSLSVAVPLRAPHNLSRHTVCRLTPWGDRVWAREPSGTAELFIGAYSHTSQNEGC